MRISIFIFLGLFFVSNSFGQKQSINILFGYGVHGTGDLRGYQYGVNYSRDFSKKWAWVAEVGGSLHDGPDTELIYEDLLGNEVDGTIHFVNGGLQAGFGIDFALIKTENHRLGITVLPIARYQATSIMDFMGTFFSGGDELPFPVRILTRVEPARTFSVGASLRLGYRYSFSNDLMLGIGASFQTDTNGDAILGSLLSLGKRF